MRVLESKNALAVVAVLWIVIMMSASSSGSVDGSSFWSTAIVTVLILLPISEVALILIGKVRQIISSGE